MTRRTPEEAQRMAAKLSAMTEEERRTPPNEYFAEEDRRHAVSKGATRIHRVR